MKERHKTYQNQYSFCKKILKCKIYFFGQIDKFFHPFFWKMDQGELSKTESNILRSNIKS